MAAINRYTSFEALLREDQTGPPNSDTRMCFLYTKKTNPEWKDFNEADAELFETFWEYMKQAELDDINNFIRQLRSARSVPQQLAMTKKSTGRNNEYDQNSHQSRRAMSDNEDSFDLDDCKMAESSDDDSAAKPKARDTKTGRKTKEETAAVDLTASNEDSFPSFPSFRSSHAKFGDFSELKERYSYKTAVAKGSFNNPPFTVRSKERISEGVNCRLEATKKKKKGVKPKTIWSLTYNSYQGKLLNDLRIKRTEGGLWNVSSIREIDELYKSPSMFPKFITISEEFTKQVLSKQVKLKYPLPISAFCVELESTTENMKCQFHTCCGDHLRIGHTLLPAGFDITALVPGYAKVGMYVLYDGEICCKVGHLKTVLEQVYYFVNRPCQVTMIPRSTVDALSKDWFKSVHGCFEVRFYDTFGSASDDALRAMEQTRDKVLNRPPRTGVAQGKGKKERQQKQKGQKSTTTVAVASRKRKSREDTDEKQKGKMSTTGVRGKKRSSRKREDTDTDEDESEYKESESSDDSSESESDKQGNGKKSR